MKVFISVDMEGVTGITDPEDVLPDGADYARGRRFMTADANAAIRGAFDAGATEVLVNDSHWTMRNLLLEDLDPRARMIKGLQKPMCMVQGLDASFDAAVFVGYHSCAGTEHGVLNHTLLGKEVQNLLLNDEPIGETRLNALIAGELGVPVVFVAGDDAVCREARDVLGEALLVSSDGIVLEGPTCSVFWVAEGRLRTPGLDTGILASVTRRAILERLDAQEGAFALADLLGAREAFLASSARFAQPIAAVGEVRLPEAPGPVTLRAQAALEAAMAEGSPA